MNDVHQIYPEPPERPEPLPDPTFVKGEATTTTADQLLLIIGIIVILVLLAVAPAAVIASWKALL